MNAGDAVRCPHGVEVGGWCSGCDMYDQPATAAPRPAVSVEDVLLRHSQDFSQGPFIIGCAECGGSYRDDAAFVAHVATVLEAGPIAEAERRGEARRMDYAAVAGYELGYREGAQRVLAAVEAVLPTGPRPHVDLHSIGAYDLATKVRAALATKVRAAAEGAS